MEETQFALELYMVTQKSVVGPQEILFEPKFKQSQKYLSY